MGILKSLASLFVRSTSTGDTEQTPPTALRLAPPDEGVSGLLKPNDSSGKTTPKDIEKEVSPAIPVAPSHDPVQASSAPAPLRCPHCNVDVLDVPKKKRKCSSCGQYVCVRKLPSGAVRLLTEEQAKSMCSRTLLSGERVLVTREEADVIDIQLAEAREQRMAEWWLKEFKFPVSEYTELCHKLKRDGKSVRWRDVIWSMCNARVQQLAAAQSFGQLKSLYYDMARFCNEERKDCSHLLKEASRAELLHYKSEGLKKVEFISGDCKACKKLDGKKYRIDVALETMPLPPPDCRCVLKEEDEHYFCKSMWAGVPG